MFAAARLATKDLSPPLMRTAHVPVGTCKTLSFFFKKKLTTSRKTHIGIFLVVNQDTVLGRASFQCLTISIVSDGPDVRSASGGLNHPLGDSHSVLGGTSRDELNRVILNKLVVHAHMLFVGQNSIV